MKHFKLPPLLVATYLASTLIQMNSPLSAQGPITPRVEGTFLGDGEGGNIQFLLVQNREPFDGQTAIQLIFTEKDPTGVKDPAFEARFKRLGSALVLSVFRDGTIFGCEVAHTAFSNASFSAIGEIEMSKFSVTDNRISGHVTTGGELDAFDQRWSVELTFTAPLPKDAFAEDTPEPELKKEVATPKASNSPMQLGKLQLPSSAQNVKFNTIVKHITFSSDSSVSELSAEFGNALDGQGWKESPGNMINKTNAIMKRELDGATLTIMVQPAGSGSTVKIFTKGLDWSEVP